MERLRHDLRFAVRLLWKDRGFAATAALTLALCIGSNAAIFAIVNAVLLQPLPVPQADRLVLMYNSYPNAGSDRGSTAVPDYFDRLRETDVFEQQALFNTNGVTLGATGDPQRIRAMVATPSLLPLIRASVIRGRLFADEDGELGKQRKVILTYAFWREFFGGRGDAVGSTLRINSQQYDVVGILPQGFSFLDPEVKLWMPLAFSAEQRSDDSRHSNNWTMVGRLKPGRTVVQAQQQIDALNARNLDRFPQLKQILINAGFHTVVVPLQADLVRDVRGTLYLLWGGVAFVLLIGVVNITNLVMVRSTARVKELATRHALGAGLGRITRQLLTETVVLTLAGGALGLLIGLWGLSLLTRFGLERTPQGTAIRLDAVAIAFTFALSFAVGLLVGIVPVFSVRRMNLSQAFREEGRTGTSGRGARAVRRVLVSAQVAFAFMLLIGAGLLFASFQRVLAVHPGFDPARVLTGSVNPPRSRYGDDAQLRTFTTRLLDRVRALPGIEAAGVVSNLPLSGNYSDSVILAEGYVMRPGESLISPYRVSASPGYFEAMGIPLTRGRLFAASDTDSSPRVALVDERLAKRFWPNVDPIGRRMWAPESPDDLTRGPGPNTRFITVVGVVGNVRVTALTEPEPVGAYYFPASQRTPSNMTLVVKASGDPNALTPSVRRELAAIDPELPFYAVKPMQQRVEESLTNRRTPMLLAVSFGLVALFLAAVGIYGVLAYQVSQRRREIGIRIALGSNAQGIFGLVLREGIVLLGIGLAVGFAGAFAIRRAIETQLFGVSPLDPAVLAVVVAVLGTIALTACAIPARRAARIDPVVALTET